MSDGHKILVKISPLGVPTIEAEGFAGEGCKQATEGLERALGGGGDTSFKAEYYSEGNEGQENHITW